MLLQLGEVFGAVAAGEDAGVDLGDEGLDPAVEDFREAGVVGDVLDRDGGVAQRVGGAAGGEDFGPVGDEGAGEVEQAGLVGNGDECAADGGGHGGEHGGRT